QLEDEGRFDPHARAVIAECFNELGEHKFETIAQRLNLQLDDVVSSWEFIKNNLTPFPAYSFWQDAQRVFSDRPTYVAPDVAIKRTNQGYGVEILEAERYQLKRNEFYAQLLREGGELSSDDRDFIRKCASRAGFFIDCIQQRWNTLRRITECLVECQEEFLDHGIAYLKPLTRAEVAFRVGFHESTVSRATANKYILLPNRRVISFDDLFDGSLAIKDAVREIIGSENPLHPLSDQDIAHELEQNGIFIARRTVAKYREAIDILPSKLRTRMDANRRLRAT
ncbi:MAG: RNA polymerase sigma-54 factor, partial [Chloroflexota bacterium]|nr:RNA polymerase sigma-54 factor [Chloroflexota bacterium]